MIDLAKYAPIQAIGYPGFYVIPGIENYLINTVGDVIQTIDSCRRKKGEIINTSSDRDGYLVNSLVVIGKNRPHRNHRLVCLAFYGLPSLEQTQVNHKDGIKDNNYFKNLEWCTLKENAQHAYDTGLAHHDYSDKPILVWDTINDPNRFAIKEFKSIAKTTKSINNSAVGDIWDSLESHRDVRRPAIDLRTPA